jgi:hypothetical protein
MYSNTVTLSANSYSSLKIPPTMPLGSMPLLPHAPEVPVHRQQLRSLGLGKDGVDFYSGPAGLLSRLKTGRWKICRYVRLVRYRESVSNFPAGRLFSCLDSWTINLYRSASAALSARVPGSVVSHIASFKPSVAVFYRVQVCLYCTVLYCTVHSPSPSPLVL